MTADFELTPSLFYQGMSNCKSSGKLLLNVQECECLQNQMEGQARCEIIWRLPTTNK